MNIGCTKKLLEELRLAPGEMNNENPFFSWHANFLTVRRRKSLLLFNNLARYSILIYGVKANQLKKPDELIRNSIREAFLDEGILPEIADKYIANAGKPVFVKSSSRSLLTAMNQSAGMADCFSDDELDSGHLVQTGFNLRMGEWYFTIDGELKEPHEQLLKAMREMLHEDEVYSGKEIVSIPAFQFLIRLCLNRHKVWRRIAVPSNITFRGFHHVIQDAIGWKEYHSYLFSILENGKSVVRITGYLEDASIEGQRNKTMIDKDIPLTQYIPRYDEIKYSYDFGDGWEHEIIYEKDIPDYNMTYATCLDGEGNCPPEDVGGEEGYEDFLDALLDPLNSKHEYAKAWGKVKKYRDFNLDVTNIPLNNSLRRY